MLHFHKTNEFICSGGGMRTPAFFFFVANAVVLSRVFRGHRSMC
jgi:hypothetical protein